MEPLRRFLATTVASVYSPRFYASMPERSGGGALGYFLVLALLCAAVAGVPSLPPVLALGATFTEWVEQGVGLWPAELEVRVTNGQASTNVPEPYLIPLPSGQESAQLKNLLVIDTRTPYSAAQFNRYQTVAWLTRDTLFLRDERQIRAVELTTMDGLTIDRATVETIGDVARPWVRILGVALAPLMLLAFYLLFLMRLAYLVAFAFAVWLLLRLFNRPRSYGLAYKVGLYAMTLGMLVDAARLALGLGGFSFMFTLITLAVLVVNYAAARQFVEPTPAV
jgi:hypothetical protein